MARAARPAGDRLLAFRVGGDRFAVAASLVREVGRVPRLTHVPHAPPGLLGLGNFRGTVLPVLSFARLHDRPQGDERRVILLDTASPIALAVDGVDALSDDAGLRAIDAEALARGGSAGDRRGSGRVAAIARTVAAVREAEVPLVAFQVADQEFALPIGAVEEVLALPDRIAILPQSDAVVVGSITLRDVLLPLLSLQALLALEGTAAGARRRVVVVRIGTHRVGLVVDALRGVLRVAESRIDAVPPVLARGSAEARIQAVCRLDDGRRLVSVLAVEHLIREDLTARLLETGGSMDMTAADTAQEASEQFLIFRIGDTEFGLPIGAVIEVAALPPKLGRLPKAPPFVQGLMTLRGLAVPVIDQSLRFVGTPATGARRRVVVVRVGMLTAGFVVDAVAEVRRFATTALRPAPEMGGEETRVFDRVAAGGEDAPLVLIVSPQELLDRAERDLLAAIGGKAPVGRS